LRFNQPLRNQGFRIFVGTVLSGLPNFGQIIVEEDLMATIEGYLPVSEQ
jgi:hypothetical protein